VNSILNVFVHITQFSLIALSRELRKNIISLSLESKSRLEQEKIPQVYVDQVLHSIISKGDGLIAP
jgi:hypothetical protein